MGVWGDVMVSGVNLMSYEFSVRLEEGYDGDVDDVKGDGNKVVVECVV